MSLNDVPPDQVAGNLRKEAAAFKVNFEVDRLNKLEKMGRRHTNQIT